MDYLVEGGHGLRCPAIPQSEIPFGQTTEGAAVLVEHDHVDLHEFNSGTKRGCGLPGLSDHRDGESNASDAHSISA